MVPISAVYVRMSSLLADLGSIASDLNAEIKGLKDRIRNLGISWLGTAYETYSIRLIKDLEIMERTSEGVIEMCGLLCLSLSRYQDTEMKTSDIIGGLER